MSIVKINAITIKDGAGEEFIARFAERAGKVETVEGFEGFQVLRPTDERTTWLVVTRWRDEAAYTAWYSTRPHRDPSSVTYASDWDVWSFDLLDDVSPVS